MPKKATTKPPAAYPLTVKDFEAACASDLSCDLWESTLSSSYDSSVTLSVSEMRYIANALRAIQGRTLRTAID